jgi:4-hydroxybenzoate polyprenyltransferase
LFLAAGLLNPLCLLLSPLAVVPLVVYPYGKRFTDFPHAILALAQAVAPVGAWLAVTGTFAGSGPAWVLGAAVGLWIGGFDLIYACQDAEVDREIGVRSTPARFGLAAALHASTAVHVLTFALFVWFGALVGLGWPWWIGLAATAAAFGYQHVVITPTDLSRVNRAFFTANGFVGIALFAFALLDLVLRLHLAA